MRVARISVPVALALVLVAFAPAPAAAQADAFLPYGGGTLSFDYQQWPSGPFAGEFQAAGLPFGFGADSADFQEAVGGGLVEAEGVVGCVGYAAVRDPGTGLVDIAALLVSRAGGLPPPGDYPVDPVGRTVLVAYAVGVADFVFPDDLATADLAAWLSGLDMERLLVATTGVVRLERADGEGMAGTFAGTLFGEDGTIVALTQGVFSIGDTVPADAASWGGVKSLFR